MELIFSESYVNARAELFPTAEWAAMSVPAALARLQEELQSARQLAGLVTTITAEVDRRRADLNTATVERDRLADQILVIEVRTAELKETLARLRASSQDLVPQLEQCEDEVTRRQYLLTQRRARLQSLANEAARLDSLSAQVAHDYNVASYGLLQTYAIVGAASAARASNFPLLRTAMS